jgi:hypothetical protein
MSYFCGVSLDMAMFRGKSIHQCKCLVVAVRVLLPTMLLRQEFLKCGRRVDIAPSRPGVDCVWDFERELLSLKWKNSLKCQNHGSLLNHELVLKVGNWKVL